MLLYSDSNLSGLARPLSDFARRLYLTYPHANGFAYGGRGLVLGERDREECRLWLHDIGTGEERLLKTWPRSLCMGDMLWFDVPAEDGFLIAVADNAVWRIGLDVPETTLLYREPAGSGYTLLPLPSVSRNGCRVIVGRRRAGGPTCELFSIDTTLGDCIPLALLPGESNHFHLCPGDEAWLGYCLEGPTDKVGLRVWGWHAVKAPQGTSLLDNGALGLHVGHERWAFHTVSVFAVAYGSSPSGPRGVYELFPDGRPPRLVSTGERDWHVGASQDGRWLVVDTTGPHDAPGRGWDGAGMVSDVLVIETATGRRRFAARSRRAAGFHCHPHPVFSPDGRTVFFNEASSDGDTHRVVAISNPWINSAERDARTIFQTL